MKQSYTNYILAILLFVDMAFITIYLVNRGEQFDLDAEGNLPTSYQSLKILFGSLVAMFLTYLSRKSKAEVFAWLSFAGGFLYLSLDEWFQIHEQVSRITDEFLLSTIGRVSFSAWILAYLPIMIAALIVLYIIYQRVIRETKYRNVRKWFILSVLVIFMVPVVEVLGTLFWNFEGPANPWVISLEEGLEMVGITLFTFTLLKVIEQKVKAGYTSENNQSKQV